MNKEHWGITFFGYSILAVLLFFSLYYYKERTVFLDIAYHLFEILKNGSFAIQNDRFGAFVTQLFPLVGSKMGFSLTFITAAYSTAFILWPATVFSIIIGYFKNARLAIAYLMFLLLITTHTFFWIQSEFPQGIGWLFLTIAIIEKQIPKPRFSLQSLLLLPVMLCTVAFTNPLNIFLFSFWMLYLVLSHKHDWRKIVAAYMVYLFFVAVKNTFFKSSYESNAMQGLFDALKRFPHIFNIQSNKNFIKYLVEDYYFLVIGVLLLSGFYISRRMWAKLALLTVSVVSYTFIVNLNYASGADQFYLENQYLALSVFIAVPFVYDFLTTIKTSSTSFVAAVVLVAGACFFRIVKTSNFYTNRLNFYRSFLLKTAAPLPQKLIIREQDFPVSKVLMTWGSSYEFWLLSTLEEKTSRSIIVEERIGEFESSLPAKHSLITKWGTFNYRQLQKPYFQFKDTSAYQYYTPQ